MKLLSLEPTILTQELGQRNFALPSEITTIIS